MQILALVTSYTGGAGRLSREGLILTAASKWIQNTQASLLKTNFLVYKGALQMFLFCGYKKDQSINI